MLSARKMMLLTSFQVLLLCLGFSLVDCTTLPRNEVEALSLFKRAIIEDPLLVLSNWNPLETDPCNWIGVYCSIDGDHVVKQSVPAVVSDQLRDLPRSSFAAAVRA